MSFDFWLIANLFFFRISEDSLPHDDDDVFEAFPLLNVLLTTVWLLPFRPYYFLLTDFSIRVRVSFIRATAKH